MWSGGVYELTPLIQMSGLSGSAWGSRQDTEKLSGAMDFRYVREGGQRGFRLWGTRGRTLSQHSDQMQRAWAGNQCAKHLGLAPPALGASRASKYREKWEVQGRGGYSLLLKCPTASQKLNRMLYNTVQSWQLDFDLCVRRHHDDAQATCREGVSNCIRRVRVQQGGPVGGKRLAATADHRPFCSLSPV